MKIAIVHEWLVNYAGSERVLEQMLFCLPSADLFALIDFVPEKDRHFLQRRKVRTSFLQRMPFVRRRFRSFLPLMPLAVEQFDLSGYDVVISSSHAVAKGVITGPNQIHLCMCYSPIRYAWDLQHQYLAESGLTRGFKSMMARYILHRVRIWDARTANGVDQFLAISRFIGARIAKVYRRESVVVYPPVDTDAFDLLREKEDFYLTASRLVPYKRIDLIVDAFAAMPDRHLVVIGDGPDSEKIRAKLTPNITMMGHQPFSVLRDHMRRAKAFVFAAEEDFGIAPLEAQACGTPVIAFAKGGALETIVGVQNESPTGVFFYEQTVASLRGAIMTFELQEFQFAPDVCRANALRFSIKAFRKRFIEVLRSAVPDIAVNEVEVPKSHSEGIAKN
jgi:glycosyltransferase involved in cell wall biosynthesis